MIAPEGYSYRLEVRQGSRVRVYIAARPQLNQKGWEEAGFERLTGIKERVAEGPVVSLSIFHYTAPNRSHQTEYYRLRDAGWERTCAAIECVGFKCSTEHGP